MTKTLSTHFVLRQKGKTTPVKKGDRKEILELFKIYCESKPKDSFYVVKIETYTEVIVESEDYRQSILNLDV
jgi:hypothetical protein